MWFPGGIRYAWLIADANSAITGLAANRFSVNTSGFENLATGDFSIALGDGVSGGDNTQLSLVYSMIPEPGVSSLVTAAMGLLALRRRRRE